MDPSLGNAPLRRAVTLARAAIVVGVLLSLLPLLALRRLEAALSRDLLETEESRYVLPEPEWLVPLSLGYREAAAGLVWVRALTYYGEELERRGPHAHIERYAVAVMTLDPYFRHAYTWGAVASVYTNRLIDREAVETSIRLLERGIQVFPDDGELRYQLGFQYHFELAAVVPPGEAERARRRGMDEICTAAVLGGGPPWLPLVCSGLATRAGLDEVAQDQLLRSLVEVRDERTRERIEARLSDMMSPEHAGPALDRIAEFRRRWEAEMPYAPGAFYAIAGPRPPVPVADEVDLPLRLDAFVEAASARMWEADEPERDEADLPPDGDPPERAQTAE